MGDPVGGSIGRGGGELEPALPAGSAAGPER